MMTTGLKALLFAAGGATAAAGTAYVTGVLDPWLGRTPAIVAALPETPAAAPAEEAPAAAAEEAVPQPEEPAVVAGEAEAPVPPTFDLLRVEPDGSMVVVGQAEPGATVEVLAGETVIARAEASADGEFVAVLDEPLAPGDYQIALSATSPGGEVVLSTQTAVVSIPENPEGQVLALVEEPGEPSNLITVPEAEIAAAEPEEEPAAPAQEEVAAAPEAEPVGEAVVEAEEEPAEPAAEIAQEAPETPAAEDVAAAEPEDMPAQAEIAVSEPEEAPAVIAVVPAQEEEEAVAAATIPTVGVEAVEIEGDTVFVAGHAEPGRTVRVYANEIMLGDAVASDAGRFLVEARRHLPVGDYIIRADLLDEDGSVLARAAVPFEREPGESIAAVAPAEPPAQEPAVEVAAAPEPEPQPVEAAAPEPAPAAEPEPEQIAAAPEAPEAEAEIEVALAPGPAEAEETEATAPKLQRADGAVIIRRGDNLWRISRRVYGKGVRYSSIYLANRDQISDPHRIWPGQIFTVPGESEDGAPANLDAIAGQTVLPDAPEGAVAQ